MSDNGHMRAAAAAAATDTLPRLNTQRCTTKNMSWCRAVGAGRGRAYGVAVVLWRAVTKGVGSAAGKA